MQIIINAGGKGTRLWPYSTNSRPKQFSPLIDSENFLKKTYDRLSNNFKHEQIWINTNQNFLDLIKESLGKKYDPNKVLTEPERRDSFAALIAHAAVVASKTSRDDTLIFLHSDHLIKSEDWSKFNHGLKIINRSIQAKEFEIITMGIKPTYPNTQLGYIQIDIEDSQECFKNTVKIKQFREKPNYERALEFVENGNYLWNLGYYSFTFNGLIKNLARLYPELVENVEGIYQSGVIKAELFSQIPKTSFDYAISEKAKSLGVVGCDFFWEDIGNWEVARKYLPDLNNNPKQIQMAGKGNQVKLINPNKKIAFVGVSDLLLIESDEGVLVVDPKYSAEVKKVAEYFDSQEE